MIYLKWIAMCLIDWMMHVTLLVAPPVIALFTRAMPYGLRPYTWGGLWGTWDNPPQGDEGFVAKHAFFIGVTDGWRGYINRVQWMWLKVMCLFPTQSRYQRSQKMVDFSQLQKIETPADIKEQEERTYALQYLKDTDWYVTRQVEIGKVIPEEVRTARQAAREQLS